MVQSTHKQLSLATTIVALVNGMIGGSILVIPLTSQQAGWAYTIIVIFLTGLFSFYSCYLAIIHMGDQKDLDSALLRHFNGSRFLKIFYDFCVWIGLVLLLMLYFDLIVVQWQGLVPPYGFTYGNVLINGVIIVIWCLVMKFFQFGAHMMGYGIISIVGYLIFLIWVIVTRPSGPNTVPAFGTGIAGFAAMMGSAFSIQGFFIPVLKEYPKSSKHVWILFLSYILGSSAYYYIAFMGSYGIVNRVNYQSSGTIEQFFTISQWEVKLLEGIYLVHLYSVFPQYLIVCKKRFFSMFGLRQTGRKRISIAELVYIILTVAVCLIFTIFQIDIDIIIDINGAVLGFCFIYFLPSILHIKCTYFPKGKKLYIRNDDQILEEENSQSHRPTIKTQRQTYFPQTVRQNNPNQNEIDVKIVEIEMKQNLIMNQQSQKVQKQVQQIQQNKIAQSDIGKQQRTLTVKIQEGKLVSKFVQAQAGQQSLVIDTQQDYSYFYCGYVKPDFKKQIIQMTLLGIMFLFGIFIMVNGLIQVVDMIEG